MEKSEIMNQRLKSYEAHYPLIEHYSNILFRARQLLLGFIVVVWTIIIGLNNPADNILSIGPFNFSNFRETFAFLGSIAIGFFVLMKAAYIRIFWNVVKSGMALENDNKLYFHKVPHPIVWPFNVFYFVNILLMLCLWVKKAPLGKGFSLMMSVIPLVCIMGASYYLKKK